MRSDFSEPRPESMITSESVNICGSKARRFFSATIRKKVFFCKQEQSEERKRWCNFLTTALGHDSTLKIFACLPKPAFGFFSSSRLCERLLFLLFWITTTFLFFSRTQSPFCVFSGVLREDVVVVPTLDVFAFHLLLARCLRSRGFFCIPARCSGVDYNFMLMLALPRRIYFFAS